MVSPGKELATIEITRKNLVAQTNASISDSDAVYACSGVFFCRLANAMGRSIPPCTYDNTAAIATLDASVVRIKGRPKLGKASTGVVLSFCFRVSNATCCV